MTIVQATIVALASTLTALPMAPTLTSTPAVTSTMTPIPLPTTPATAGVQPTLAEIPHVFPLIPADAASYARAHHDYPATDMFAPEGTEFVAVTNGVVEEVSRIDVWSSTNDGLCTRGGLSVSLVGDDGVRYYGSHLAAVAPGIESGTRVVAGQLLGYIGSSGNARGVLPHLHFGISRPTGPNDCGVRRGEAWPYEYLEKWRAGENVVPILPE
ncbi:MAG: M23 family metallopeptidase [Anaerolineae bacterium]